MALKLFAIFICGVVWVWFGFLVIDANINELKERIDRLEKERDE